MINWFDMPAEGLSNGGLFEVKELEVTENGTYETKGEMYNKVTVNVEGGGGSSDFSTAEVTVINDSANGYNISTPFINTEDEELVYTGTFISSSSTMVLNVILYKGSNMTVITDTTEYADPVPENNVSMSGDVSYDGSSFMVTGDCTITIS